MAEQFPQFQFCRYYDPKRMHFGMLRVLNDDTVEGGMGFGKHAHENMEIISIPLEGDLEHQDSMGNKTVIKQGDVQVMSAGSGVTHSEYNKNSDKPVKFLQIWIIPDKKNVTPRYGQISLDLTDRQNTLQQIISPEQNAQSLWIHQQAWFHISKLEAGRSLSYQFKKASNGVYAFVLNGDIIIDDQQLAARDGLGITGTDNITLTASGSEAEVLLMEVPMQ